MKTIASIVLILCVSVTAPAQTTEEWFNQKQTKLKYIAQQIAAFEMYDAYLKQGYSVLNKGWSIVSDLKHGDFKLHSTYYDSLRLVNDNIKTTLLIDGVLMLQQNIQKVNKSVKTLLNGTDLLQPEYKQYIINVLNNIDMLTAGDIQSLESIITDGGLSMHDDERIKKVKDVYDSISDKYVFITEFKTELQVLILSKSKELNGGEVVGSLYNLNK